jgi:phenylalanyl-tRNA synthetase beta chain
VKVPVSWLREFVDVKVEPERLGEALTRVGLAVEGIDRTGGDAVLDLDVTTNRVDCMNVYGVARELAVIYGLPLRPLDLSFREAGAPAGEALRVVIEAAELCPRFCARVLDVRLGPSPAFIRDRLEQLGVRPIHNVVDLTNYVMMEMGHPSHAFDLARVPEGRLSVRLARAGEKLTTLDGTERSLDATMGVVAGPHDALALAGVMGGASSEVSDATRVVALEAAYWDPPSVRRTAKALGMHTEASHRFERGADPEAPAAATARIAHLLEKIGAGSTRPGLVETLGAPRARRSIRLRPARIDQVLGAQVPRARAFAILGGLGFGVTEGPETAEVLVPSWRSDVAREEDLVEEVGRHHGLDRIPSTYPAARLPGGLNTAQARERRLRELLLGFGLSEALNLGLVDGARAAAFEGGPGANPAVKLLNPLSSDFDALRSSLLPSLLGNLQANQRQGRRDVALFELGRVFAPAPKGEPLPREERRLAFVLSGGLRPRHWSERGTPADFYAAKGLLEALAARLDVPSLSVSDARELPPWLHPGRSARVKGEGGPVGFAGALHPDLLNALGLRDEVVVAEVVIEGWLVARERPLRTAALEKFPAVLRDLSLLSDESLPADELVAAIRSAAGEALRGVEIRDRYLGDPVPKGRVSLTVGLRFQESSRTLTGEEVQAAVDQVTLALRKAGVDIRGEAGG